MTGTRRELLRLGTLGLGSLATVGLGTRNTEACWWQPRSTAGLNLASTQLNDKRVGKERTAENQIRITSMCSGTHIGRTFTVYGDYELAKAVKEGEPLFSCYLQYGDGTPIATGAVTSSASPKTWLADFVNIPSPPMGGTTGLKLTAIMTISGSPPFTSSVIDLVLDDNAGLGISIDPPKNAFLPAKARAKPTAHEYPSGDIEDDVLLIRSTYVESGEKYGGVPIGDVVTGSREEKVKKWHAHHADVDAKKKRASHIVSAVRVDPKTSKLTVVTRSVHNIDLGPS